MNNCHALGIVAALALAGCGSQVAPTGGVPLGAMTPLRKTAASIPDNAKRHTLIYVSS